MAHPVNRFVYRTFLFNVGVRPRDIGLGLVIIIITDEIFHRIVREKAFEFAVKLCGKDFIGRKDQRRPLHRLNHLGNGEGLARSGNAEQYLVALLCCNPRDKFGNRGRLIPGGRIIADNLKPFAALHLGRANGAVRDKFSAGFRLGKRCTDD